MNGEITRPFADNIWTVEGDRVRMLGIPFGTRMTVIRLADDNLWLHSPIKPTDDRFNAVVTLGDVGHIVAPNKLHYLFVAPWAERFSSAQTWADAALRDRRPDLHFDNVLGATAPAVWRDDIDQVPFAGSKVFPETVFFHEISRTQPDPRMDLRPPDPLAWALPRTGRTPVRRTRVQLAWVEAAAL